MVIDKKFLKILLLKQKRTAFTLAEVLITLGIIGVVAAMTIPNLMANINGSKFRSQFKKAISTLNQAGRMSLAQYEYSFGDIQDGESLDCKSAHPEVEMSICAIINGTLTGHQYIGQNYDFTNATSTYNGWYRDKSASFTAAGLSFSLAGSAEHFVLADGSIIGFESRSNCTLTPGQPLANIQLCRGYIDVNGISKPNKISLCYDGTVKLIGSAAYSSCVVPNKTQNMGDIYPFYYYNDTVIPATNAGEYILKTAK
jgi:prepilin-type N-terminal cleavage/methylation domain-containing protein